jgi:hypothetical protein
MFLFVLSWLMSRESVAVEEVGQDDEFGLVSQDNGFQNQRRSKTHQNRQEKLFGA